MSLVWLLDLDTAAKQAYKTAYEFLSKSSLKLLLTTYFNRLGDNLALALNLPTAGIHLDFAHERGEDVDSIAAIWPKNKMLSAGVIDGRNVWSNDLCLTLELLKYLQKLVGSENLIVAPSCSLLHVPPDLDDETRLDKQIRSWLAFAKQKLNEINLLTVALNNGMGSISKEFEANNQRLADHRSSPRVHKPALKAQLSGLAA